ncbi:DUF4181 domain-containing protein [Halobacillus salinarum]|uniref:DUF4181 domain-containing protein n=1 Tax=Halobacillus salinarum TaxID=2932257 RepID=A0ABY4EFT5_9BACI|nr:DUF4181 domain-containing protein [Halobacillus salinarum]UOQ42912.1 DUF4181 domain-containing protein [Halobacillus salinarum]
MNGMYGGYIDIGLLIILIAAAAILWIELPAFIVRKCVGAPKKKWFSYNHVNNLHKNWEWMIRIIFLITFLFVGLIFQNAAYLSFSFVLFFICLQIIQTAAEWKYRPEDRYYLVSLSRVITIFVLTIALGFTTF